MVAPAVPDGVRGPPPHGRVSFGWHLIIPLIIQPIRQDPPGSSWIDGAPNVSSPDQSGADQIDAEHQATDLAVWPWRCWPMPHLAVPFPAGHPSGSGRFRCRLSSRPLPQCPRAHAAVVGVHSAGRLRAAGVRRPRPLSERRTVGVCRLRRPEPRGIRGTGHRGSVRRTSGSAAGCWPDGCSPRGRGSPEQSGDMAVAGGRPSMHAPPATAVDARRLQCPRR
jgi:hypothetical protein